MKKSYSQYVSIGQIAQSKAGRDRGVLYIIVEIIDDDFVKVCDGEIRKLDKPKKKRIKHLQLHNKIIENFSEMQKDVNFNDAKVRTLLREE